MHDIFRPTTKIKIQNNQKKYNLNWNFVFYSILAILIIVIIFSLISYFQKKLASQYEHEINTSQQELSIQYKKILENSDLSTNEIIIQGLDLLKKNQLELSVIAFEESIKRDPEIRDANILAGYGFLHLALNNNNTKNIETKTDYLEKSKKYLKKAKEIDPINPLTYQILALTYLQLNDEQNTKLCYNKFKELKNSKN